MIRLVNIHVVAVLSNKLAICISPAFVFQFGCFIALVVNFLFLDVIWIILHVHMYTLTL